MSRQISRDVRLTFIVIPPSVLMDSNSGCSIPHMYTLRPATPMDYMHWLPKSGSPQQPSLEHVAAISFDGDDTLWDFQRILQRSLNYVLVELRGLVPILGERLTLEMLEDDRRHVAAELRGQVTNLDQIRLAAFRRTLCRIGVQDEWLAQHLNRVYVEQRFKGVELFDDVLPAFDALQGHYKLGIVSNGNAYPESSGLAGRFQFVVFSEHYGVEKPDPRLFQIALREAGCSASQWFHVGDSLLDDVAGAQSAGGRAVWVNRTGRSNDTAVRPDFEVSSLTQAVEICKKAEPSS